MPLLSRIARPTARSTRWKGETPAALAHVENGRSKGKVVIDVKEQT